ncbi:MAG: UDP-2,3-diacylglucosamine diphosphatase LpxI [Spirochaetia bacterium]|nr:UDP-2,3-diacylglucosamine diphosphatase LpxI [Spirochaetia bacterium]
MKIKNLGIIAGSGILPAITADEAIAKGINVKIYIIKEGNFESLDIARKYKDISKFISITKVGHALKEFKKDNISHLIMIGKISKENLFKNLKFDLKTLWMLKNLTNRSDNTIFYALADEFFKYDIEFISQKIFLKNLFLPVKVYSKKKPSAQDLKDINYGMYYAKKIGKLDIGQTVVVRYESILAVEAIEGTDKCIERAGILSKGKGAVVCKTEKEKQDCRFDVPAIGITTLETMKKSGAHLLAFEAEKTLIVTPEEVIKKANELKLILVGTKVPKNISRK